MKLQVSFLYFSVGFLLSEKILCTFHLNFFLQLLLLWTVWNLKNLRSLIKEIGKWNFFHVSLIKFISINVISRLHWRKRKYSINFPFLAFSFLFLLHNGKLYLINVASVYVISCKLSTYTMYSRYVYRYYIQNVFELKLYVYISVHTVITYGGKYCWKTKRKMSYLKIISTVDYDTELNLYFLKL